MSNFSNKKEKESIAISATSQKKFFIEKLTEKSELLVQIAKASEKNVETTDQKVHNFQLTRIRKKWKQKMTTVDLISIRGQQNFEDEAKTNPKEIKLENDNIQNKFEKYKKIPRSSRLKVYLLQVQLKMTQKKYSLPRVDWLMQSTHS